MKSQFCYHTIIALYYSQWFLRAYCKTWTGLWTLDFGLWTLDYVKHGLWTVQNMDFGLDYVKHGLWTLDYVKHGLLTKHCTTQTLAGTTGINL